MLRSHRRSMAPRITGPNRTPKRGLKHYLRLESLEARRCLTASMEFTNGILDIRGSSGTEFGHDLGHLTR